MVFHTAPPQPASNAPMTCSPQLVGGPDASQNGFGHRMRPANSVERSATLCLQAMDNGHRRPLAIGHCVHHFAAAVDAVAARVIFWIVGPASGAVYSDQSAIEPDATGFVQQLRQTRLADRRN